MGVTLIYKTDGKEDAITFDATPSETHTSDVDVTQHPIETGAKVSDHILRKPQILRLEAVVTDFPLGLAGRSNITGHLLGNALGNKNNEGALGRAAEIYKRLERLQLAGTLAEVRTSLKTYKNMAIKSLSTPRTAATKNAIKFSAMLEEVRLVDSQVTPIAITKLNKAKGKQNNGPQNGTAATKQETSKSYLAEGVDDSEAFRAKLRAVAKQAFRPVGSN